MVSRQLPIAALTAGLLFSAGAIAQSEVTLLRVVDTDRFDPHTSTARAAAEILFMIGDTLVTLDYDLKTVQPGLAESWEISEDGKTYTFNLRDDVTFCSGKPFTAHDVVATINRWLDPETNGVVTWRAGDVDEVVAVDDHTVEYKLNEPYAELLYQMTQHFHTIINVEQAEELGEDFGVTAIDGTGPFCFESWTPRDSTVLTRHEAYNWGPPQFSYDQAQVDRLVWQMSPEESPRLAAIQTGQADATQYLPFWAIEQLQADPNVHLTQAENYFWTYFVGMKITRENMGEEAVRRAINLAVDTQAIADSIFFGHADVANAYIHPATLDYNEEMDLGQYSYDLDAAATLLDEAGWTMGDDGTHQGRPGTQPGGVRLQLAHLAPDHGGHAGGSAQGRRGPGSATHRRHGDLGQAEDPGIRRVHHELSLRVGGGRPEPVFPLGQYAHPQPDELGRPGGDRCVAEPGLGVAHRRETGQMVRHGAGQGPRRHPVGAGGA